LSKDDGLKTEELFFAVVIVTAALAGLVALMGWLLG
jgi:hypothetical protein